MAPAKPSFPVPAGDVAKVSIVDSTMSLTGLVASHVLKPPLEGFAEMGSITTWAFLVESPTGKKALFDLGCHLHESKHTPRIQDWIREHGWKVEVKENAIDIIRRHGVDPKEINSVVWSHLHFDHIGDATTLSPGTEVVVGPGFKEAVLPGWPTKEDSPIREEDLAGRHVRELDFSGAQLKAGDFPAIDFFGDGSFYLLSTPGHCVGHISGLARTSKAGQGGGESDTFIMMGGDLVHHGGEIRPSPYLPVPDQLPSSLAGGSPEAFKQLNVKRGRPADDRFFDAVIVLDAALTDQSIRRAQVAEADPNVWFIFAHDMALREASIDLFPKTANDWKAKGWKDRTLWAFLDDLSGAVRA